ncbi:MAG: hypothetical protein PHQ95_04295 [Candidatus Gracilibacteria bacterium]|nr:hypothetical protein [Candidatus Gracilibacteria bacterium]
MKKFLIIICFFIGALLSSLYFVFAGPSIQVSAIVGSLNHSPVITDILPASDPKLLGINQIQNYTIYFRDDEKDVVTYTITPASGYVYPISGTINSSSYDTQSGAYVNFTYLAPGSAPVPYLTTITVTLNDGVNVINKILNLYIY